MGVAAECDTGRLRGKFGFKSFLQDRELASSVGGVNILNRIDQRGNLHREVCRVSGFSIVQQLVSYRGDESQVLNIKGSLLVSYILFF